MPYKNHNRFNRIKSNNSLEIINKNTNLLESLATEYGKSVSDKINGSLLKARNEGYSSILIIDHDCDNKNREKSCFLFGIATYARCISSNMNFARECQEIVLIHNCIWYKFDFNARIFKVMRGLKTQ